MPFAENAGKSRVRSLIGLSIEPAQEPVILGDFDFCIPDQRLVCVPV